MKENKLILILKQKLFSKRVIFRYIMIFLLKKITIPRTIGETR